MLLNAVPIFSQILALTFDLQLVCTARLFFLKGLGNKFQRLRNPNLLGNGCKMSLQLGLENLSPQILMFMYAKGQEISICANVI